MLHKLIIQYIVSQSTYITTFCIHFYKKILKYVFLHKNKECSYALPISPSLKKTVYRYLPTITSISLGFTSQLSSRPNLMSASSGLSVITPLAVALNVNRSYKLGFLTSTMALQVTTTDGRLLSTLMPP